jgi:hypothetical protein
MSIGQTIKAGFGMSVGQRIATSLFGPLGGSSTTQASGPISSQPPSQSKRCETEKAAMEACMEREQTFDGCDRAIRTYHACLG